jgi:predicted RNase H-like HicB family nuclease
MGGYEGRSGEPAQGENLMTTELRVNAVWDEEADVWVAISDDVPGLATEADTIEHLLDRLPIMIPELLALNGREPCLPRG